MTLRVLDQSGGLIETHGLIVEHGGGERGQIVAFQVSAGIGDESEASGVGFRESIESERSDGLNDFILRFAGDAFRVHAAAQLDFDFFHAGFGAFEAESAAKFFGFTAGESCDYHRHAQ